MYEMIRSHTSKGKSSTGGGADSGIKCDMVRSKVEGGIDGRHSAFWDESCGVFDVHWLQHCNMTLQLDVLL
jgi:hypothetical protein